MPSDIPACLDCGVCCFSELPTYVRVLGADYEQLGERAEELTEFVGNRCFMSMRDGHCAALALDEVDKRFVCTVYQDRPAVCRDLQRGSPACHGEIQGKRERPLLAWQSLLQKRRTPGHEPR